MKTKKPATTLDLDTRPLPPIMWVTGWTTAFGEPKARRCDPLPVCAKCLLPICPTVMAETCDCPDVTAWTKAVLR